MLSNTEIDQMLDKLVASVQKLASHERARLIAERDFLKGVRSSYEGASAATKNAEVAKVLEELKPYLSSEA